MSKNKILEGFHKVRFQDCDPFNHLNNSKYIDYLINVREDCVERDYGFNMYEVAYQKGIGWVVGTNQIAYLKPAFLMENVACQSQIVRFKEKSLTVEYRMYDEKKTHLKAIMWTQLIHVDVKKQKSRLHDDEFLSLFEEVVSPVGVESFEERLHQLRETAKKQAVKN